MDNNEKMIAAIDIGTTKIATVVARHNDGKYFIDGFGTAPSIGIKHGVVRSIDDTVEAISKSLNELGRSCDADFNEVFVGIAGQYVTTSEASCRIKVGGVVAEKHLDELKEAALNFIKPGNETLDAILMAYIIDNQVVENPVGMTCDFLCGNFHIVTGQTAMVNNIKKCVVNAGLKVRSVFLEPLASAEAVLTSEEKQNGVVLIDIGGGTTDIAVYRNGEIVHTAVIPIGGATITGDIKDTFSITYEQAENIKCLYGSAVHITSNDTNIEVRTARANNNLYISRNQLSEVIQARMEEILNTVKFQIETIFSEVPSGIVITGGGSLMANLNQLASFILKNKVRLAYPSANIDGNCVEDMKKPQYATVVGLVMKGNDFENGILKKEFVKHEPEPVPEPKQEPKPTPTPTPTPEPEPKKEPKPEKKNKSKKFKGVWTNIMKKIEED
ncbi:MAG: cell division protein FtsA [Bacteroidales bacterium]|nr:cell division protein FtsA [Bacteroidales bacterium]